MNEQEYDIIEEEESWSLTLTEIVRMMDYLRAVGLTTEQICDCIRYMATGVEIPKKIWDGQNDENAHLPQLLEIGQEQLENLQNFGSGIRGCWVKKSVFNGSAAIERNALWLTVELWFFKLPYNINNFFLLLEFAILIS